MRPADLLATAETLTRTRGGHPSQTDLRKAVSAAYYAVLCALSSDVANRLIGPPGTDRSERAWRQAYRAVDHGFVRHQCRNQQTMAEFPPEIQIFATNFVSLQEQRHAADYDPDLILSIKEVQATLDKAAQAIAALAAASEKDRCDFAAWVTLRHRT